MSSLPEAPQGQLMLRVIGQPGDTGEGTRMFGGWIMGQMDMAGGQRAVDHAGTRTTTVAVNNIRFLKPMHVGDEISAYARIAEVGRTSMVVITEMWFKRGRSRAVPAELGAVGSYVFVSLDDAGKPAEVKNKDVTP